MTSPLSASRFARAPTTWRSAEGKSSACSTLTPAMCRFRSSPTPRTCAPSPGIPKARILATTCDDLKIRLWDVSTGTLALPPLEGHHVDGMVAEFNHRGDRLASTDWGGTMRLWDSRTGRQLLTATGSATVFSADDRRLGVEISGSRARLLRVADGRELQTLVAANPSRGRRVYRHAWYSPDGRFLMVDAIDSLVFLDPARGVEIDKIPFAGTSVVAFEPGNAAVLTWDKSLVLRWPIRDEPATATIQRRSPRDHRPGRLHGTRPSHRKSRRERPGLPQSKPRGDLAPQAGQAPGAGTSGGRSAIARSAPTGDGSPRAIITATKVWGPRSGTPDLAK